MKQFLFMVASVLMCSSAYAQADCPTSRCDPMAGRPDSYFSNMDRDFVCVLENGNVIASKTESDCLDRTGARLALPSDIIGKYQVNVDSKNQPVYAYEHFSDEESYLVGTKRAKLKIVGKFAVTARTASTAAKVVTERASTPVSEKTSHSAPPPRAPAQGETTRLKQTLADAAKRLEAKLEKAREVVAELKVGNGKIDAQIADWDKKLADAVEKNDAQKILEASQSKAGLRAGKQEIENNLDFWQGQLKQYDAMVEIAHRPSKYFAIKTKEITQTLATLEANLGELASHKKSLETRLDKVLADMQSATKAGNSDEAKRLVDVSNELVTQIKTVDGDWQTANGEVTALRSSKAVLENRMTAVFDDPKIEGLPVMAAKSSEALALRKASLPLRELKDMMAERARLFCLYQGSSGVKDYAYTDSRGHKFSEVIAPIARAGGEKDDNPIVICSFDSGECDMATTKVFSHEEYTHTTSTLRYYTQDGGQVRNYYDHYRNVYRDEITKTDVPPMYFTKIECSDAEDLEQAAKYIEENEKHLEEKGSKHKK